MKIRNFLAAGMTVLRPEIPNRHIYSMFSFGDSYTTTSFNSSAVQPSPDNPMGNPELGQGTATDNVNWVGYMTTVYNKSVVLNYNLAVYGATVNDSVVDNEPEDLVYQISNDFRSHYCLSSFASSPRWSPDASLFTIWIGINDIQFSYQNTDPFGKIPLVLQSYFRLVEQLYECGARRFLIINVPPTTRTPKMLLFENWHRKIHQRVVTSFNRQLEQGVYHWRKQHKSASMVLFDSWSFMTKILDNPREYGFLNSDCIGDRCIWWDGYHPSSAFHRLLAADIRTQLDLEVGSISLASV
ncbi:GDSL lipase/esterase [Talaromyces proteolyticus]|uniref:GDSL lipase/esterase n=1 Tax=Talaromyces proteolyticus TaxID=1131652 RepID=A0AAD4KL48_9EURO|nr:GDSL lipase/esterase [Talaromyces proteolyticus]KAH8693799.1 GDSL lipase/esterase [Talaromyces proteolyticus]